MAYLTENARRKRTKIQNICKDLKIILNDFFDFLKSVLQVLRF